MRSQPRRFPVVYERDEDGWWVASVPSEEGVHTQGRSLSTARRRVREALSLVVGTRAAVKATLDETFILPQRLEPAHRAFREAEARAREAEAALARERERLLRLADRCDLSQRDTAEVVGLSHQRVQQLLRR